MVRRVLEGAGRLMKVSLYPVFGAIRVLESTKEGSVWSLTVLRNVFNEPS
jgi:hypothetical protein